MPRLENMQEGYTTPKRAELPTQRRGKEAHQLKPQR